MKPIIYAFVIVTLLILVNVTVTTAMQSANYRIEPTTFSSAGGVSTSASYSISFTLGQSTAIGESTSPSYGLVSGFWYQLQALLVKGDIDGDGYVDLHDVVFGLKILTGGAVNGISTEGDINNDSRIGLEEVIFDLNKVSQ